VSNAKLSVEKNTGQPLAGQFGQKLARLLPGCGELEVGDNSGLMDGIGDSGNGVDHGVGSDDGVGCGEVGVSYGMVMDNGGGSGVNSSANGQGGGTKRTIDMVEGATVMHSTDAVMDTDGSSTGTGVSRSKKVNRQT